MKDKFKKIYFLVIGLIIFGVVSVSASILLQPEEVSFISDKTSQTTVKGALDELYEIAKGDCPVGHICTTCGAGTYANQTTMECVTCPSGYTSDAGAGKEGDCYIQTTAGKYIKNAGDSTQTNCPAGSYCLSAVVKYGETNTPTSCPGSYTSAAGASALNKCYIQTTAGKYIKTANSSTQTTCPANSYCMSAKVYYGSTGNIQSCASGKISNAGSTSASDCKLATYNTTRESGDYRAVYRCENGTGTMIGCYWHDTVTPTGSYHGTNCGGTSLNGVEDWWCSQNLVMCTNIGNLPQSITCD